MVLLILFTSFQKQDKYKDTEPTAIDLFKEMHCCRKIGFTKSVKKAIVSPCFLFSPYSQQSPSENKPESNMQD